MADNSKVLAQQKDYLHDLCDYAQFFKDYLKAEQERKNVSGPSATIEEKSVELKETTKEDIELISSISRLVDSITKVEPSKFGEHVKSLSLVGKSINQIVADIQAIDEKEIKEKLEAMDVISKFATILTSFPDVRKATIKMIEVKPFIGLITGTLNDIVAKLNVTKDMEKTKGAMESIKLMIDVIDRVSLKMVLAAPLIIAAYPTIALFKLLIKETQWAFKNIRLDVGSEGLDKMSANVFKFAKMMTLAGIFMVPAAISALAFKLLTVETQWAFKNINLGAIENGSKSLEKSGKEILKFVGMMSLTAVLIVPASLGIAAFKLLSMETQWAFKNMDVKVVETGATAMTKSSLAILAFAGSIALSALIMRTVMDGESALGLIALFGSIATTLFIFKRLGSGVEHMQKGAIGLIAISASIAVFAVSLMFSTKMFVDPLTLIGSFLLMGGMFAFIELFSFAGKKMSDILKGTLVIGIMSLAIFAFSISLMPIISMFQKDPINTSLGMLVIAGGIIALAGAFYVVGLLAVQLIPFAGVALVAAMAGSIWVLGRGLQAMKAVGTISREMAKGWEMGITSVFKGISNLGLWDVAKVSLAIPAMISMALSLPLLAGGMDKWSKTSWTKESGENLKNAISSISAAYASAPGGSIASKLGILESDAEHGIRTTMLMGSNLKLLADGVFEWTDQGKLGKTAKENMDTISVNIATIVSMVGKSFSDIGVMDKGGKIASTSIMSILVGNDFSKGNVDAGISSIKNMGAVLKSLAQGVFEWSSGGRMGHVIKEIPDITKNISNVLTTIPRIFSIVGILNNSGKPHDSWLAKLVGNDFSRGNVDAGVTFSKDIGSTLESLAKGVKSWSTSGELGKIVTAELPNIQKNIIGVLKVIPQAFSDIGKDDKKTEGWFSKGDIAKGVDLISKLSPTLSAVSSIVNSFYQLGKDKKENESPEQMGKQIGMAIQWIAYGINVSAHKYMKSDEAKSVGSGFSAVGTGLVQVQKSASTAYTDLKKLIDLHKPLEEFLKLFTSFTSLMKDQFKEFSTMQLQNVLAYGDMIDKFISLGKLDATVFKTNTGYMLGKTLNVVDEAGYKAESKPIEKNFVQRAATKTSGAIEKAVGTSPSEPAHSQVVHLSELYKQMQDNNVLLTNLIKLLSSNNTDDLANKIAMALTMSATPIPVISKNRKDY